MTTKNMRTLHVEDTVYDADSVEWCPISPAKNIFACGTYHLVKNEEQQQRVGSILLYRMQKDKLEAIDRVDSPAVLDMKWCPRRAYDEIVLAVANAIGEVCLFQLEDFQLKFMTKCSLKKNEGDCLVLSLDWSKETSAEDFTLCASDSEGNLSVLKFINGNLQIVQDWNAHSLEAWIVCFDSFNPQVLYSGGDDVKLQVWDTRTEKPKKISTCLEYSSGVTALQSSIHLEHCLASGSYDEKVLIWDTRNWKHPKEKITVRGGLWRVKWEPKDRTKYLLCACIYGGFQILDVSSSAIVADYREHESLAYGADWCHLPDHEMKEMFGSDEMALLATCSFYDHKLCVSLWDKNEDGI